MPLASLYACLSEYNVIHAREVGTQLAASSLGAAIGSIHPRKKTISLLGIISKQTTTFFLSTVVTQEGKLRRRKEIKK
jgi:hypothetical protein